MHIASPLIFMMPVIQVLLFDSEWGLRYLQCYEESCSKLIEKRTKKRDTDGYGNAY